MLDIEDSVLLIIDIQEKLLRAVFNKEELENKAEILAKTSNILSIPIFVTEQYPTGLGETVSNLKDIFTSETQIYEKTDFNAFNKNEILGNFSKINRKQVLICGIETHICIYQTAEFLLSKGYEVTIAADACGSRSKKEYDFGLKNLASLGAKIKTVEMIVFELLKTAKHPNFKEIQALIK